MVKQFTTANFETEVLQADKPVLVDFYADWCGPCKMMAPLVDLLADEYEGRVIFGKLNTDEETEIAEQYRIMTIPTLAVFKAGNVVDKLIGINSKEDLIAMLDKA